jgi:hypothetical protein
MLEQDRDTGEPSAPARSSGRKRKPSQRLDDSETSASATSRRRSSSASSRTSRNETSINRNWSNRTSSIQLNQDRSGTSGSMDLDGVAAEDALINESIMRLPDDEDELINESLIGGVDDEEIRPDARTTRDRVGVSRMIPPVTALSLSDLCEIVVGMCMRCQNLDLRL